MATQIAAQAPLAGPYLTRLLGGSGPVGVVTLARFYGLHVLLPPLYLYRQIFLDHLVQNRKLIAMRL